MAKAKTVFYCKECGHESSGWLGKCPSCGAWNSFIEERRTSGVKTGTKATGVSQGWLGNLLDQGAGDLPRQPNNRGDGSQPISLSDVRGSEQGRISSGADELDRVLGGGFVGSSLVLVGGDPGIGKSTLLLQVAAKSKFLAPVLYVNGEESVGQVKLRADRLGLRGSGLKLLPEIVFERIAETIVRVKPTLCIVDSIQTVYSEELSAAPGSVSQVRDVTAGFLRLAKALGCTIVLVGHVTKDGQLAGPRVLEHMVDTVLYFEGEGGNNLRALRAVKNRFGATNELGIFEMTEQGLVGMANPSAALLEGRPTGVAGSALACVMEGLRPLFVEVQALLNPSAYSSPQRQAQGIDRTRLNMLMAVLENRLKLGLGNMDAFINVVGGLRLSDTASDLAICMAAASSFREKPIRNNCILIGEVGLTGEVRMVTDAMRRIDEAGRMGMEYCVLPGANRSAVQKQISNRDRKERPDIIYVDSLSEAIDISLQS